MSDYVSRYCTLINSPAQLDLCRQMQSLGELLACIKNCWDCHSLSDDELLGEIQRLNQIAISSPDVLLAGNWLPYRYQPKQRQVHWLIPDGHATEPFQDEYISRCCQQLFNQIIQPRTSLESVQQQAKKVADVQPAGFIFHLSRCGSTLLSGCLSELDSTCVFSESPLLTELLLDNQLTPDELQASLRVFINLQAAAFPNRPHMIIKWNAWDIFQWDLIHALYPQVPAIFLVRNPVEILASHHKMAGRHMASDSSLACMHPLLQIQPSDSGILEYQTRVIGALLEQMLEVGGGIPVIDYFQLDIGQVVKLCRWFGCEIDQHVLLKIQDRLGFHSKHIGQAFTADSEQKRQAFNEVDAAWINGRLGPVYNELMGMVYVAGAKVVNA